jgi:DNA-binding CsgD family transcriptional regulator
MPHIEIEMLLPVTEELMRSAHALTPAECVEVHRIAQGFACKDSAVAGNVSPETIRARRKRIYRKLGVTGAGEVLSALLGLALQRLAASPAFEREGKRTMARESGARAPVR